MGECYKTEAVGGHNSQDVNMERAIEHISTDSYHAPIVLDLQGVKMCEREVFSSIVQTRGI